MPIHIKHTPDNNERKEYVYVKKKDISEMKEKLEKLRENLDTMMKAILPELQLEEPPSPKSSYNSDDEDTPEDIGVIEEDKTDKKKYVSFNEAYNIVHKEIRNANIIHQEIEIIQSPLILHLPQNIPPPASL